MNLIKQIHVSLNTVHYFTIYKYNNILSPQHTTIVCAFNKILQETKKTVCKGNLYFLLKTITQSDAESFTEFKYVFFFNVLINY